MAQKKISPSPKDPASKGPRSSSASRGKGATYLIAVAIVGSVGAGAVLFMRPSAGSPDPEAAAAASVAPPAALTTQAPASDPPQPAAAAAPPSAQRTPAPRIVVPPRPAPGKPHGPGLDMPPLEMGNFPPPLPPAVVQDIHTFAADHPEILNYVPCFCGCESGGHTSNNDCFVAARDASGRVTEWEPHGVT